MYYLKCFCAGASAITRGRFNSTSAVKYLLDDVRCMGTEQTLFDCQSKFNNDNCHQGERAGVQCLRKSTIIAGHKDNGNACVPHLSWANHSSIR